MTEDFRVFSATLVGYVNFICRGEEAKEDEMHIRSATDSNAVYYNAFQVYR